MNRGNAVYCGTVWCLNPLLIGAQCEQEQRNVSRTNDCLNPLLIGAQCELVPDGYIAVHGRLNPLLIGAQCERGEEGVLVGRAMVSIPF